MRKLFFLVLMLTISVLCSSVTSCNKANDGNNAENNTGSNNNEDTMASNKISIKIGLKTFIAMLSDNNSAKAFHQMLPLTFNMTELNGNEKYYDLSNSLPANSSNPGTIQNGDVMLYGSKTLVLFYKTFSTSYSYTKLGRIEDTSGLAGALGSGNARVSFDVIQ
jgi:hypothetical protein